MAVVRLEKIYKKYDEVVAVDDFNLTIADKEFVVLVGPSGCGKTTTLRMIAGLESITSGKVYIGENLINKLPAKDRNIAMVFQNYALYPHMTVFDNMAFSLEMRKRSKDEIKTRVQEAAEILGIQQLLSRKPKQLSGGQRQRVAMGRALARNPKVFLFDEPLSNLDAKLRVEMRTEIKLLHQRIGTTIVYVTHDQIEAMTLADRIAVMKDGVVQQLDTPRNVYENPVNRFVAGFIGSPSMNFIPCRVTAEDGRPSLLLANDRGRAYPLAPERWTAALTQRVEKQVILGLRPEHITEEVAASNGDAGERIKLESTVQVVEPTGPDTLVMVPFNDTEVTCRVHPGAARRPGEAMPLTVDLSKAILFDPDTETRLQ